MSTKDFIFKRNIDEPRHEQNMPEGIDTPVPNSWVADGPGYLSRQDLPKTGKLIGHAGPNVGYAITLAKRASKNWHLLKGEHLEDVETLLAEIAMRRSSYFGRAPIQQDVQFAAHLLGYSSKPEQGEENWRPKFVHGVGHEEHKRRIIVNSIPQEIISGSAELNEETISGWWEEIEELF